MFAEGEEERVLRAVQVVVDEGIAQPILVGRPAVIEKRIERFGLRLKAARTASSSIRSRTTRYREYWQTYHRMTERKGVTEQYAKIEMRRRPTLIGAMVLRKGDADGMICGTFGTHGAAPALHRPGHRHAPGGNIYARDERADAARPPGVPRRHARQRRPDAPSSSPRSP